MVPLNEPQVLNVTGLACRSTIKVPWAPANRPVPPVMVWISVIPKKTSPRPGQAGGAFVGPPKAVNVVSMVSPFSAIQWTDPVADPSTTFIALSCVNEKSPRWVPVPMPLVRTWCIG